MFALIGMGVTLQRFLHWQTAKAHLADGQVVQLPHVHAGMSGFVAVLESAQEPDSIPLYIHQVNHQHISFALKNSTVPAWLAKGQQLVVTLQHEIALYRFPMVVRSVEIQEGTLLLKGVLPQWAARIQRRQSVRATISLPASLQIHPQHTPLQLPPPQHCTVCNLSALGMCIEIDCAGSPARVASTLDILGKDTIVTVRLPIPALTTSGILAKVLHSERGAVSGGIAVRARCQFLSLASWEQELIIHAVFQAQAEAGKAMLKAGHAA